MRAGFSLPQPHTIAGCPRPVARLSACLVVRV